jgi:hypothetical protein
MNPNSSRFLLSGLMASGAAIVSDVSAEVEATREVDFIPSGLDLPRTHDVTSEYRVGRSVGPAEFSIRKTKEWTSRDDRRFEELAVRDALGEITDEELPEFEMLTQFRRRSHHKRPLKEILEDDERRALTKRIIDFLK